MTKDDIIRMAVEAGFSHGHYGDIYIDDHDGGCDTEIERFANLVAAHEREVCVVAGFNACVDLNDAVRVREAIRARSQS